MDFDKDGINDLVVGAFEGNLSFVRGLGSNDYAAPVLLKNKNGKVIHAGQFWSKEDETWVSEKDSALLTQPRLVDWDNDGDLDILNGGRNGQLSIFINQGDAKNAAFSTTKTRIIVDAKPGFWEQKQRRSNPSPEYVDWDGDGLKDLIILYMDDKKVVWAKNIGSKEKPTFAAVQKLLDFSKSGKPKSCCRLSVADFNGDGKLDLIIGGGYYISESKDSSGMWVFEQK